MPRSNAELLLEVQLEQAGIPFEREYRFHPERKWRVRNLVESRHGEAWSASNRTLRTLRPGVSPVALRSAVLLASLHSTGMASAEWNPCAGPSHQVEAAGRSRRGSVSAMRQALHAEKQAPRLVLAAMQAGLDRGWQGMGEGCPGRPIEPELEGRRRIVQGVPQQGRAKAREAATLLSVRDHRSEVDLRLGESDRQLRRHGRLRPYVPTLPSAVRP